MHWGGNERLIISPVGKQTVLRANILKYVHRQLPFKSSMLTEKKAKQNSVILLLGPTFFFAMYSGILLLSAALLYFLFW